MVWVKSLLKVRVDRQGIPVASCIAWRRACRFPPHAVWPLQGWPSQAAAVPPTTQTPSAGMTGKAGPFSNGWQEPFDSLCIPCIFHLFAVSYSPCINSCVSASALAAAFAWSLLWYGLGKAASHPTVERSNYTSRACRLPLWLSLWECHTWKNRKHLHNVETRFYCPQAFLNLDVHCEMDVSELK